MSQITLTSVNADSKPTTGWARGFPSATPSSNILNSPNDTTSVVETSPQPISTSSSVVASRNAVSSDQTGNSNGGGHSRKHSVMVGVGGVDIKRGNLAFGTVDSPGTILSSSPAAPSTTGGHLDSSVKSFGTIDADGNSDPDVVKTRRTSSANPTGTSQSIPQTSASPQHQPQHLPSHTRRQSLGHGPGGPGFQGQAQIGTPSPMFSGPSYGRPPNGFTGYNRPPAPNHNVHHNQSVPQHVQQGFRPPPAMMSYMARPNALGPQVMPRPMLNPGYNIHLSSQGPYSYPQGGLYYPNHTTDQQTNFGASISPWSSPQVHQNQFSAGLQPRDMSPQTPQNQPAPSQSQSPMPVPSLLSSGGPSPLHTPPNSTGLLNHHPPPVSISALPTNNSRQDPAAIRAVGLLSGRAAAFTPRTGKSTIKLTREDGSSVDIEAIAGQAKPAPSNATPGGPTNSEATKTEAPKRKITALPVVVRVESEEQKKARLAEEGRLGDLKIKDEKEAQERKERLKKKEKEEKDKKVQEEMDCKLKQASKQKAKAEAEKIKMDDAYAAEEFAVKKLTEENEAMAHAAHERDEMAELEKARAHDAAQATRKKADEQRRALLSTPDASTLSSLLGSPPISALVAGLPAKPVSSNAGPKHPPPPAVDKTPSSSLLDSVPSGTMSTLRTARRIENIASISYPSSMKSPNADLNANAAPGRFRYDRDFLMQFMNVCREKPESLPPLEEIGLEAGDGGSSFGNRGPRGGKSAGNMINRVTATSATGLGIGGITRPFSGQGMGSFGMGQFGSGSGPLRATSEQRYQATLASKRTSSHSGPSGLNSLPGMPSMVPSNSRSGTGRGSQHGFSRAVPPSHAVAPMPISENAWTRTKLGGDTEGTPAFIDRKVKALLNKLTEEKFEPISKQILEWANKSKDETDGLTLKMVIKLIFEKATDEAHWSAMYAKLCRLLYDKLDAEVSETIDGKVVSGRILFRKYLLGRCQIDFQNGWKAREDTAVAAAAKEKEDGVKQEEAKKSDGKEGELMSDEYYAAQKAKRRGLGLVQLIGELFKMGILSRGVISECLVKLLSNVTHPDEEDIESASKLLTTVGSAYEEAAADKVDTAFMRLDEISKVESLPSRIQFMILDVIDLRQDGWKSRKQSTGVMTIAEIHKQNAQEKSAAAAKESVSRGGSRAGRDRRDVLQTGEWQSVQNGPRLVSRPTDFSGMGRNISASGVTPSFTSSSVFANRKGKAGIINNTTPPISRQASSNMFSALNDAHEHDPLSLKRRTSTDVGELEHQRPKIQLAPRTKPLPDDDAADLNHVAGEETDVTGLSEDEAKLKIDLDSKELWGEKDQGGSRNPADIVDYFSYLPESRRSMLAERLVADVFRISKRKEAEIVGKGWRAALEQQVVTSDALKLALERRMPSLDDDSLDFPAAYTVIAILVRSISLSEDDVETLGKKIEVEGNPRITPEEKLHKALMNFDEEASIL